MNFMTEDYLCGNCIPQLNNLLNAKILFVLMFELLSRVNFAHRDLYGIGWQLGIVLNQMIFNPVCLIIQKQKKTKVKGNQSMTE